MHLLYHLNSWLFTLLLVSSTLAYPKAPTSNSPRPMVLWHGLGDSHSSPGMLEFISKVKEVHPGIFIHSIYIEEDLSEDQRAGTYGNVNDQVEKVAAQIANITELEGGFDAMGFSQGGQFLRAYVERYNTPKVHNLVTFGAQHLGVSDIGCTLTDFFCQIARRAIKGAVYSQYAQEHLVQAQYFRDPNQMDTYLTANHFLPDINNEVADTRNATYAENFASLNNLVLVLFSQDKTVVPKESSWFGSEAPSDDMTSPSQLPLSAEKTIIPMRLQPLYKHDWIGLRKLDKRGAVVLETCEGEHMQMGECWERIVKQFIGGKSK